MKLFPLLCLLGFSIIAKAQKTGVNTKTPTEDLDVAGTLRVRALPLEGALNAHSTTGANTASTAKDQPFNGLMYPVVTNSFGVLGQTDKALLVPIGVTNTTDASASMMVVKRYTVTDDIGGVNGKYSTTRTPVQEFDTGMSVTNWQAFMSNAMWVITEGLAANTYPFVLDKNHNYRLKATASGTWKVIGDIPNIKESGYVDILFIKSSVVAADPRTN